MSEVQSKRKQEKMIEEQEVGELGEFAEMQYGLTDELANLFYEQDDSDEALEDAGARC